MPYVDIEETYWTMVSTMTPAQKFARTHAMNVWARWNIARRITEEQGELPPELLKWQIALWIYRNNDVCRKLIEEHLAHVHD